VIESFSASTELCNVHAGIYFSHKISGSRKAILYPCLSITIYNSQKMEAAPVPTYKRMGKESGLLINEVLLSLQKEGNSAVCSNISEP
jgi:hypothetical protein